MYVYICIYIDICLFIHTIVNMYVCIHMCIYIYRERDTNARSHSRNRRGAGMSKAAIQSLQVPTAHYHNIQYNIIHII